MLYKRYAGFMSADDLTPIEKLMSIASLVPAYAHVVEEARDTIERLNEENANMRWRLDGLEK